MGVQPEGAKRPYQPPQMEDALKPFLQWHHPNYVDVRPVTQCKFKLISSADKGCIAGLVTCYVSATCLREIEMSADEVTNAMRGTIIPEMEKRLAMQTAAGLRCPAHIGLIVQVDETSAETISEASCDD